MGWNTQPPTNPPERSSNECEACDGAGQWITTGTPYGDVLTTCQPCEGTGEIQPMEPDTWKEAWGWA